MDFVQRKRAENARENASNTQKISIQYRILCCFVWKQMVNGTRKEYPWAQGDKCTAFIIFTEFFSAQFCFCTMAKMCSLNYGSFCSINVHEHACNVTISIDMWGILAFKMFILKRYFYANCPLQLSDVEHCKWIR